MAIPSASGGGLTELWARLRFVVIAVVVYRIGAHIPVPGINPDRLADLFEQSQGTILSLFNMFSGGALERMSILALGIMPYISASIVMQLLTAVVPSLEALKKEGEAGRRKITQYTAMGQCSWQLYSQLVLRWASPGKASLLRTIFISISWLL